MRIGLLTSKRSLPDCGHHGHWGNMAYLLKEGLADKGVEVTLFGTGSPQFGELPGEVSPDACEALRIAELFERADEFDVLHNLYDPVPLTYAGLVNRPVLTTLRGQWARRALPVLEKYGKRSAYVSVSDADRVPGLSYVATVYHSIDARRFAFQAAHQGYLVFAGRISPETGAAEAIEIAGHCGKDLLIVGPVEDQHYFDTQIGPRVNGTRVRYLGMLANDSLHEVLGAAEALVHPIRCDEAFSFSIVEANACGTPAIAYPRGCVPEIVIDGVNGILAGDLSSAVLAVQRLARLSRVECRRVAEERFSIERMAEGYLALYRRMLREDPGEEHRPWGYYQVLSDLETHKVKRIVVYPDKRLSLQRHRFRSEHWFIVSGAPVASLDGNDIPLGSGQSIDIPVGAMHRIFNPGGEDVVFIEVQRGTYFGEDDIERTEDDFGRT